MIQAKTYCEVCMTGHYGDCPKLKATLTYTTNLPSESEPKSSPKTISLDTPTIDDILTAFYKKTLRVDGNTPNARAEATQALVQWHKDKARSYVPEKLVRPASGANRNGNSEGVRKAYNRAIDQTLKSIEESK